MAYTEFQMFVVCFVSLILYLPLCSTQGSKICFILNGKAEYEGGGIYSFTCNPGYWLKGPRDGPCFSGRRFKAECVKISKATSRPTICSVNICEDPTIYIPECPHCAENNMDMHWECLSGRWVQECKCRKQSVLSGYVNVTYSPTGTADGGYSVNTNAIYSCYSPRRNGQATYIPLYNYKVKCTKHGWTNPAPTCVCAPLLHSPYGRFEYDKRQLPNSYYPYGTVAKYVCPEGYSASQLTIRKCGALGWSLVGETPICARAHETPHATPHAPSDISYGTTLHNHQNNEVVIVSATTGAIIAALVVLVIIVSCQRRLHYHRIRRARLRCRQDQDAFSAYITYHRNVGLMLPSYDEACNELHQGEPPTFDEAVASTARQPSDPLPSPPPDSEAVVVRTTSIDDVALSSQAAQGRFVRALCVLFGSRGFSNTPESGAVYARITPDASNESLATQESELGDSNSLDENNTSLSVEELNNVLSRAGLC